jgi:hypothetical protein
MTGQERDVEEVLSRVFHTTTDPIEPVGDGLTKIRGRLAEPWLKRQWWLLRSELLMLRWFAVVRCESFLSTVRSHYAAERAAGAAAGRLGSLPVLGGLIAWASAKTGRGDDPRRSPGPVMNWLRPTLAVAGAVVLVVAGVFALGQIREGIISLNNAGGGGIGPGTTSQGGGHGIPNGGGRSVRGRQAPSAGHGTAPEPGVTHRIGPRASTSPCASPSSSPAGQPTPSPSPPPPSPTPSPSVTPTSTPTPSPSVTPSTSQAPLSALRPVKDRDAHGTRTTALVCTQAGPSPTTSPA